MSTVSSSTYSSRVTGDFGTSIVLLMNVEGSLLERYRRKTTDPKSSNNTTSATASATTRPLLEPSSPFAFCEIGVEATGAATGAVMGAGVGSLNAVAKNSQWFPVNPSLQVHPGCLTDVNARVVSERREIKQVSQGALNLRFVIIHGCITFTVVNTKGKACLAHPGFSTSGTNLGARVLAVFSSKLRWVLCQVTIATVWQSISWILCDAFGTMQTNVFSTRTDFQLVFTLNSKVSVWTNTVFP